MLEVKNQTLISIKKEDRIYEFKCVNEAPLGEVFDALSLMRNYVVQRIQEAEKASEEPKEV